MCLLHRTLLSRAAGAQSHVLDFQSSGGQAVLSDDGQGVPSPQRDPHQSLRVGLGRTHLSLRVTETFLAWSRAPTMRSHWSLCDHLPQSISRTPSLRNGQSQRAACALHFVISSQSVWLSSRLCGASSCWGLGVQSPTPASKGGFYFFPYTPVSPSVKWDSGMLQKSQQSTYLYRGIA